MIVAVGGNTLSRGLTLEGLAVSFFVRTASAYDTLLQMGRWFGYRNGYADLTRIWMTDEMREWFHHLATVEQEIRYDIERYETEHVTPDELGVADPNPPEAGDHRRREDAACARRRSVVLRTPPPDDPLQPPRPRLVARAISRRRSACSSRASATASDASAPGITILGPVDSQLDPRVPRRLTDSTRTAATSTAT